MTTISCPTDVSYILNGYKVSEILNGQTSSSKKEKKDVTEASVTTPSSNNGNECQLQIHSGNMSINIKF